MFVRVSGFHKCSEPYYHLFDDRLLTFETSLLFSPPPPPPPFLFSFFLLLFFLVWNMSGGKIPVVHTTIARGAERHSAVQIVKVSWGWAGGIWTARITLTLAIQTYYMTLRPMMMHHHAKFDSEKFIRSEDMEGSFLKNLKHSLKKMDYASTDFDVKWLSKALLHISLFSFSFYFFL